MTRRTLLRLLAPPNAFALASPRLRVAVVQMSLAPSLEQNRDRILGWIAKAAERKARVVVFPEGALSSRPGDRTPDVPAAARAISRAARKHRVYVLYGGWTWSESAGRDALWNEIAELAAVAGARIHVNVAAEPVAGGKALLRRRRIATALASFRTLTLMANRTHSAILGDLTARAEIRSVVRGAPRPDIGPVRIYSAFSANLIAEAGRGRSLLLVRRRIPGPNPHYPALVRRFHPPSAPWFARSALQVLGKHSAAAR